MIKSMTGFGRCLQENDKHRILVELRAVNHRYCEISVKIPKKFNSLEQKIRSVLKEYVERGKIDVFIGYENFLKNREYVKYNGAIAGEYLDYAHKMAEEFGIANDMTVSMLSKMPDVFALEEQQEDGAELWTELEPVLRSAFSQFVQARQEEGSRLCEDILGKLHGMEQVVDAIEQRSPQIVSEYRVKLQEKVNEFLGDSANVDKTALATEIVIFADKICVDEETVRLRSHMAAMCDALKHHTSASIGRKLDFIAQEMNREANTILSKANDIRISEDAIQLKTDIEKVREQIQNIE